MHHWCGWWNGDEADFCWKNLPNGRQIRHGWSWDPDVLIKGGGIGKVPLACHACKETSSFRWWCHIFFCFTLKIGEDSHPFSRAYVSNGLLQPPPSDDMIHETNHTTSSTSQDPKGTLKNHKLQVSHVFVKTRRNPGIPGKIPPIHRRGFPLKNEIYPRWVCP